MRIVCRQTILMKYHTLFYWKFGKMSQHLSSAAVVIGAFNVAIKIAEDNEFWFLCFQSK